MTTRRREPDSDERTFTRREWLTRRAIMSGASAFMAIEAVSSVAIEHDWDMDTERKTMAEWDMMEHHQ
jgi:hypothetical protein